MAGLSSDQVDRLVIAVYSHSGLDPARRRAVGPYRSVLVVLIYLRFFVLLVLVVVLFGCFLLLVFWLFGRLAPVITTVLTPRAEQVAAKELRSTVRVDGFLAPIGDRREGTCTSGMCSGTRHRCGFNIQVVGAHHGRLVLVGSPQPGSMHDAKAWRVSGLAEVFTGRLHADGGPGGFADTAYTGTGLCVPRRKPKDQQQTKTTHNNNHHIASHRASVERVIAHLKNWKLLATGYRGLLDRFPTLLDTITKLEIYRTS